MNRRRWLDGSRNWPGHTRGTATGGSGPSWIARAGRSTRRRFVASRVIGAEVPPAEQAVPKPRRPHGQDRNACHLRPSRGKDDVWTWDFIFDRTSDGRSLKWLSLVDEYTRECLALEARRGMTARGHIRIILAEVAAEARRPAVSAPERQRPGVRGPSGAFVAGGDGFRSAVRGTGEPLAERLRRSHSIARFATNSWTARSSRANRSPSVRRYSEKGGLIRNARTVPWDTEHRPNSRRLARGMCL